MVPGIYGDHRVAKPLPHDYQVPGPVSAGVAEWRQTRAQFRANPKQDRVFGDEASVAGGAVGNRVVRALVPPLSLLLSMALAGIARELAAPSRPAETVVRAPTPIEPGACRGPCLVP